MTPDKSNDHIRISAADKKRQMLEKELEMLNSFYERNAITKENYEKGIIAIKKELELIRQ